MKIYSETYRFEFLLFALIMVIFNKIFFFSDSFYSRFIWPANLILLGVASMGISPEKGGVIRGLKIGLFLLTLAVPLFSATVFESSDLSLSALTCYLIFYLIVFTDVMRQVIKSPQVNGSVILGTLSGFLLLIVISTFTYLLLDFIQIHSFANIPEGNIPAKYQPISYFSIITLTSIGYGDILPVTDNSRLLSAFWGVAGQFYMVAVVGIIISKFSSK